MDVAGRVIEIISDQMGIPADQIAPDTDFVDDLGADSLDTVEMVMEIEEEFDISISDDIAETLATVGDVVRYVEGKVK